MSRYAVGMQIGRFRLDERLGGGASGEVFRAVDIYLGRVVALKLLSRIDDDVQKERFLQEARLGASLLHPNIAIVHEIGFHGEAPFLVQEFVEGEMLSRRIRKGEVN